MRSMVVGARRPALPAVLLARVGLETPSTTLKVVPLPASGEDR